MAHELDKLDNFLGIEIGMSFRVLIQHQNPAAINKSLLKYGIILDKDGILPKSMIGAWQSLMCLAGIDSRYWKDKDLLQPDTLIDDL